VVEELELLVFEPPEPVEPVEPVEPELELLDPPSSPNRARKPPAPLELLELERLMVAWSPCFTWPIWVSSTVLVTLKLSLEITTIWADEVPDEPPVVLDAPPVVLDAPPRALDADAAEELFEADPEPVTCWPVVRFTDATVPAMVEVSEASARLVWADVSWDWAEVTDALSERIWLVDAPLDSSLDSLAWADVRLAWAESTVAWRAEASTEASTWPAVTV